MKKTACLSLVFASFAALAADTTVDTGNQMGVLSVTETSKDYLLIAVPWNEFGTGNTAVSIETLVNPDQLTAGDKLYVADGASYKVFTLQNNQWVGTATATVGDNGTISENTGSKPSTTTVTRGNAVWLYRQTKNAFYLLGQKPESGTVTVPVVVGNNLVASPSVSNLSLSSLTGLSNADSIRINGNDGTEKNYAYSKTKGWMKQTASGWAAIDDTDIIPAGQGFWYRAKAAGNLSF